MPTKYHRLGTDDRETELLIENSTEQPKCECHTIKNHPVACAITAAAIIIVLTILIPEKQNIQIAHHFAEFSESLSTHSNQVQNKQKPKVIINTASQQPTETTVTYDEGNELGTNITTIDRKQILIVTEYRSGSSFIGETFNKDYNIMYLFEPLILSAYPDHPGPDGKQVRSR